MSKAKIYYFTLQDEQTKEEKLEWFEQTRLEQILFEHITPDRKHNWVNLTDNDFDDFLPLIDKQVKASKSQEAVFQLFSAGVKTQRDEWVYDFSKEALIERMKYFVEVYQERLRDGSRRNLDIKWDRELEKYLTSNVKKSFHTSNIVQSIYRPYTKQYLYFDKHFNGMTYQLPSIFPSAKKPNKAIWIKSGIDAPYFHWVVEHIPDVLTNGGSQCLPLYRYDENGTRIDNITDWALEQFRQHYKAELDQAASKAASGKGLKPLVPHTDVEKRSAEQNDRSGEPGKGLKPLVSAEPLVPHTWWFVTFVTHNARVSERMVTYGVKKGEPLIFSAEDQIFIAEQIAEAVKRYEIAIAAFNVLPDHVHMVVAASTEAELNEKIRKIKGFSSHQYQRSRDWDKGQHVWAQKFNRQAIENEIALTEILEYVLNNHTKHAERWGNELITIWNEGVTPGNKGLKPLVLEGPLASSRPLAEIVREVCVPLEELFSSGGGTRGLSPLSDQVDQAEITKLDIFHYTYAVLHHPAYRTKYELNLKREFPRLPYYPNFQQWATWGKTLMDLHLTYETAAPYGLERIDQSGVGANGHSPLQASLIPEEDTPAKPKKTPKPKLKADKTQGHIILDTDTTLTGVPAVAWDYKLGNRSALEWILDQYKEKKPKDPTIRELFNTYRFADYKEHVIDLLQRVCTVSVETMKIIHQMPDTVEHEGEA
ncbi:MAG: type ISP restriction/modification enzyme [Thainema sp.]